MMSDKSADYNRGYRAGKRLALRAAIGRTADNEAAEFMKDVFLVALRECIDTPSWKAGEKPITSLEDRTQLAWNFAREAEKQRPYNARPSITVADQDEGT